MTNPTPAGPATPGKCLYVIGASVWQESESGLQKELKRLRGQAPEKTAAIEKSHFQGRDFILQKLNNLKPALVLIDRGYHYFPENHYGFAREKEERWQDNLFAAGWAKQNNVPAKLIGLEDPYNGPEDKLLAQRAEKIAVLARDRFLTLPAGNVCLFVEKTLLDPVCSHLPDIHPAKRVAP